MRKAHGQSCTAHTSMHVREWSLLVWRYLQSGIKHSRVTSTRS